MILLTPARRELSWTPLFPYARDLLKMKRAAGQPQDLADVRLLESLDDAR